jgi:hypothetical protein
MQIPKAMSWLALLALVFAACSGGAGVTQQPGTATQGTGGGRGTATEVPAGTEPAAGGGGGKQAGWDQYGKVHIEISGPVQKSADYGFIPAGSVFGGAQGSSLNFTIEGTNEIVALLIGADGKLIVSYGGPDFTAPAAECTTSNWNIGATSGSGSFDCSAVILASGAQVTGATIKGTFDAHV